jgi:hypothetical protein
MKTVTSPQLTLENAKKPGNAGLFRNMTSRTYPVLLGKSLHADRQTGNLP